MSTLDKKLVRDLWRMRGQLAAVALVAMCGTATFITMAGAYDALVTARDRYYRDYRFADVFANAKRAPRSLVASISAIPGVATAEDRLMMEVTLDVSGFPDPASGLVVSVPDVGRPRLNDVHVVAGRYLTANVRDEVLLGQGFADAHRLRPGDSIAAVVNGRWQRLHIAGIANSPEFVYVLSGAAIFPDNKRYGVMWMNRSALEDRLDMKGAFNAVLLRLAPGASEKAVMDHLDQLLKPYGSYGAQPRSEQSSHQMLDVEIKQDRVTGTIVPAIFLGVTAFLIHNVLMRLIALQRGQIGVFKAFGYADRVLAWHYFKLALAAVAAGALCGVALGTWLGIGLTALYEQFFHLPSLVFHLTPQSVAWAIGICVATAALGAVPATLRVLALPPAESMRPEPPPRFRKLFLERIGYVHLIAPATRMMFRNLERRPLRALASVLAIALSCALLIVGQFGLDALDETVRVQFQAARRDDIRLGFHEPRGESVRHDLASLPGVLQTEPFRVVGARVRYGHASKRIGVFGLPADATLHRVLDIRMREVAIPEEGLVLSASLADALHARPGDLIELEILEGDRRKRMVTLQRVVDEPVGMMGYMNIAALARLMGEGPTYSDAYLRVDPLRLGELYERIKRMPVVSSIALREATLKSFLATIGENLAVSVSVLIGFAAMIAAGVVYNGARIALSEHAMTLASLRILGFRQREVTTMLLGEQAIVTAVAIPCGFAIGYGICVLIASLLATEFYRVPLVVSGRTYAWSALTIVAAATVSGLIVAWRARRLDLIAVLKTRE
ncbi:MAG: ABC transporter permease [Burkholderiales bacterium]